MKRRKLATTAAHHENSRHPLINRQPAADERLAHSRQSPRGADAEEMFTLQADSTVHCYLELLFFNLVEAPDALIEFTVRDDRSEAMFMLHLVLFLLASGLAEEKLTSLCRSQFVATKKLLRRSG